MPYTLNSTPKVRQRDRRRDRQADRQAGRQAGRHLPLKEALNPRPRTKPSSHEQEGGEFVAAFETPP